MPPTVVGYYLIVLLGRRGVLGAPLYDLTGWTVAFTWYAAVIASTVMALPLLVRTARAAIDSVDRDLERAAYTLGRSELRTTLEVTLPLARNGILAGLVLAFARALGEFGATLMLAGNIPGRTATVPLSIYTAGADRGERGGARAGGGAHRALLPGAGRRQSPGDPGGMTSRLEVSVRKSCQAFAASSRRVSRRAALRPRAATSIAVGPARAERFVDAVSGERGGVPSRGDLPRSAPCLARCPFPRGSESLGHPTGLRPGAR